MLIGRIESNWFAWRFRHVPNHLPVPLFLSNLSFFSMMFVLFSIHIKCGLRGLIRVIVCNQTYIYTVWSYAAGIIVLDG